MSREGVAERGGLKCSSLTNYLVSVLWLIPALGIYCRRQENKRYIWIVINRDIRYKAYNIRYVSW